MTITSKKTTKKGIIVILGFTKGILNSKRNDTHFNIAVSREKITWWISSFECFFFFWYQLFWVMNTQHKEVTSWCTCEFSRLVEWKNSLYLSVDICRWFCFCRKVKRCWNIKIRVCLLVVFFRVFFELMLFSVVVLPESKVTMAKHKQMLMYSYWWKRFDMNDDSVSIFTIVQRTPLRRTNVTFWTSWWSWSRSASTPTLSVWLGPVTSEVRSLDWHGLTHNTYQIRMVNTIITTLTTAAYYLLNVQQDDCLPWRPFSQFSVLGWRYDFFSNKLWNIIAKCTRSKIFLTCLHVRSD